MWINSVSCWHSDIFFRKLILFFDSLVNKLNFPKFDLSKTIPSWLLLLIQGSISNMHFIYSTTYSLKQAQIWSQEYVSLSGSSADLKDWQCRITEKNELTKKVITWFSYKIRFWLQKFCLYYLAHWVIPFLDTPSKNGKVSRAFSATWSLEKSVSL